MNLYHISEKNLDNKILYPRIPNNYMTKNGYEDNKTPRVSFSKSIDGCLIALSANIKGKEFYIYEPIDNNVKIKSITNNDVPDANLTDEVWILEPVKIKVTGKIKVLDSIDEPLIYKYGNNEASLYKWKWKSISLTESVEDIINYYNGYKQGIFEYTKEFEDERIRILKETDDSNIIESLGWIPGVPINSNNIFRVEALNKSRNNYIREVDFTQDEVLNDKNKFYDWVLNTDETIEDLFDKEYIKEIYIFNEKDLYINFDKFESNKSNILFITGLSGGGKSTLATKLASKYKAEVIELDIFEHNKGYSDENLHQAGDVFVEYFLKKRKDLRDNGIGHGKFREEFDKFFSFVLSYCNRYKDKKFIIEGVQIYSRYGEKLNTQIKGKPIILINTSMTNSFIQRFKRNDFDGNKVDWREELKEFPKLISWYINSENEYKEFKKELLKEEYIEEKLSYKERQKLKDSDFGLPKLRKYPLHDEAHIRAAIKFFNHVDKKYEKELAENIIKRMNELNFYDIEIGKENRFYKYYQESIEPEKIKEDFEYIIEEANKRNEEPIYILLTRTGTAMSKVISTALGDFYTHVSISFDLNMNKIYAFDKQGFIIEELQKTYKNQFGNIPIAIYCTFINKDSLQLIKNKINDMLKEKSKYHYNYLGALGLAFEKPVQINYAMFCSEFVDQLLKLSGNDITGKNSGLVAPQDFKRSKLVYKIYEGTLNRYSVTRAQKNLSKLKSRIFTDGYYIETSYRPETLKNVHYTINNLSNVTYSNGDFYKERPFLLKRIDWCKTVDELEDLKIDTNNLIIILKKLKSDLKESIKNQKGSLYIRYKNGLTPTKIQDQIEWLEKEYKPKIDEKIKKLKSLNEFTILSEMLNIAKDSQNDWHTYASEPIGGLYNFGPCDQGLHNYLKISIKPNLIVQNDQIVAPHDIRYGDELTLSEDDMEYIIRKMYGSVNKAIPIDHPDNKHPNYTKSDLSEFLDESCIYIEERFDYWKKDKDGNKILDEDKIKKDLSDIQNDRDKDRAFKLLCNLFLKTLSDAMNILGFTLMITIIALPVGLLLSILAVIIKYSVYAISKEERLNKLKDSLDKEINKLNRKIQKESNEDKKKEMRRLLGELEKCNKIISDTLKNYEQQNNLKLKQKNIRKLDTYNYVEFDPDEYTKSEIISLMKKYKEGKQDLTLQTIEFFYLCDYTEKSFIKLIGSNRTKELIEYLEDTKSYNVIEYFKNKTLGRIADNGAGDETLYCQEDKKVYFFNHEEHPQISLSNTTTLNSILSTSKQMCMKQPILMNIYSNKDELLKESYIDDDYIIKESRMLSGNKLYYRDKDIDDNFHIYANVNIDKDEIISSKKGIISFYIKSSSNPNIIFDGENFIAINDISKDKEMTIAKSDMSLIKEAKEFPVQIDKDGSLIIKNIKKLNFEEEYQKSHKLLLSYEKTNNYEGMKYELSKLWYMNIELERRIYDSNRDESKLNEYTRARARILNDFNKYIKLINKVEKDFNFSEYYEDSPFNDGSMKLRKSTLDYLGHYLKQIVKSILI